MVIVELRPAGIAKHSIMKYTCTMSSRAERQEDQIACRQIAKAGFTFESSKLQQRIAQSGRTRAEAYWHLGRYTFDALIQQHGAKFTDRMKESGVVGPDVSAKLLSLTPDTYREHCEEQGMAISLEQLRESLKRSMETPRRFQNIPDPKQTVEKKFGLLDYDGRFKLPGFRFEETEEGLVFAVDDGLFTEYASDLEYDPELPPHWQKCPADTLMERCWPAMVDLAADTPELFAHDLGLVNATYRQQHSGALAVFACGGE